MTTLANAPESAREERRSRRPAWDGTWGALLAQRIGRLLISLWVLITAAFLMIHVIPGDPVRTAMGPTAAQEAVDARREMLGLDNPLAVQYLDYLRHTLTGDFGTSIISGLPVADIVAQRLPASLELAVIGFVLTMLIAVPSGLAVAVATRGGRRTPVQLSFSAVSIVLSVIPGFLLAVVLVYVFAVQLRWLPIAGQGDFASYILPVLSLSLGGAAAMARIVRTETAAVLSDDFIRTARAKRLPGRLIYLRHALPNAVTATLTIGGMVLTGLVMGTILIENVFAWPGLGSILVQSIIAKDYPVVQTLILLYGAMILVVNLVVDLLLAAIDPRSKMKDGR